MGAVTSMFKQADAPTPTGLYSKAPSPPEEKADLVPEAGTGELVWFITGAQNPV